VIEFWTLGSLDLKTASGEPVATVLAHPKRVAVLAYLALAQPRGFHRRDILTSIFWPNLDHEHARHALRQVLHELRQVLGGDAILRRGDEEVALNFQEVWCDAAAFEAALDAGEHERALEHYRGGLLNGLYISESAEFERWLETERARFANLYASVVERLALQSAERGDLLEAVSWWQRASTHDPYNTRAAVGLMMALAAAGDRPNALRHAERHVALLKEELDVEPDATFHELVESLRSPPGLTGPGQVESGELAAMAAKDLSPAPLDSAGVFTDGPPRTRTKHLLWVAAAMALVGSTAAVVSLGRGNLKHEVFLDPNVAVVLPFMVSGGGEELAEFGEHGVGFLLEPWLTGEGTPRPVSQVLVRRALLSRPESAADGLADITRGEALDLGRRLGAGQVWLGALLALPNSHQLRVSMEILSAEDGERMARSEVLGSGDSIVPLFEQLVLDLLPQQAGERHTYAELMTPSLDAMRAYLRGRSHYMAGEWHAAITAFNQALEQDSAFALAAFYLSFAAVWDTSRVSTPEWGSPACQLRDRLGRREQTLLRCDRHETPWAAMARLEEGVRLAPDMVEAWYPLGDHLYQRGAALDVPNVLDSAAAAFDRAISLAYSAYQGERARRLVWGALSDGNALLHRAEIAAMQGDAEKLRALIRLYRGLPDKTKGFTVGPDSLGNLHYLNWLLAWVESDTARGKALTEALVSTTQMSPFRWIIRVAQRIQWIPMDVVEELVNSLDIKEGSAGRNHNGSFMVRWVFALNRGRPREARAVAAQWRREATSQFWPAYYTTLAAVAGEVDSAGAWDAVQEIEGLARRHMAETADPGANRLLLCGAQLWRLQQNDFRTLDEVERLRFDSVGLREIEQRREDRACAYTLAALAAHKLHRADEQRVLARLDSTAWAHNHGRVATLVAASIHHERGELGLALDAVRKRTMHVPPLFEATFLRLEGDFAAEMGDREAAIGAYTKYLRLRSDPDPALIPERDRVRRALAELEGGE